jgi:speckle-type POZ protein
VEDEEEDLDVRVGFARALLEVADRYDMERLKMICTDVLCNNIYAGTALPTLQLSHKLRCLKLNQACVEFIRDKLDRFNMEKKNYHI